MAMPPFMAAPAAGLVAPPPAQRVQMLPAGLVAPPPQQRMQMPQAGVNMFGLPPMTAAAAGLGPSAFPAAALAQLQQQQQMQQQMQQQQRPPGPPGP
jgi:hypothetical protein